jgi:hypothetical protein
MEREELGSHGRWASAGGDNMTAWEELAISAGIAAIVVYWFHWHERFTTVGATIVIGASIMLTTLAIVPGDIRRTIDIFFAIYVAPTVGTLFGLFMFVAILWLGWTWVAEKIRRRRKN